MYSALELTDNKSEIIQYNVPNLPIKASHFSQEDYPSLSIVNHWHTEFEFIYVKNAPMWYSVNGEQCSGKFITAFFRNPRIKDAVHDLLKNRDGLMLGICNGFQALVKLGLVPFGEIMDMTDVSPTLTFNTIARHQSMLVRTRIASNKSPWL